MAPYKKYYLIRILVTTLFGLGLGILFFVAEPYAGEIFDILLIAMGLLTVIMNLPAFIFSLFHIRRRGEWISLLISSVAIVFGIVLTLIQREVLLLVLGLYSVIFPAVRVFLVYDRKQQLKRELPSILFGLFMVFVSIAEIEELILTVCGIAVMSVTGLYLLWALITMKFRFAAYDAYVQELAFIQLEAEPVAGAQQEDE